MKNNIFALYFLLAIFLFSGCIATLNPLYTEDNLIYDPSLIGVWAENDSNETWEFYESEGKSFKLIHTDENGQQAVFVANLLTLKGNMFMDIFPEGTGDGMNDLLKMNLLPVHSFFRIMQIEPELQMAVMNLDWMKNQLKQNPKVLHHHFQDDRVILTGSTSEIQNFIIKHLNLKGVFEEPSHMKKL